MIAVRCFVLRVPSLGMLELIVDITKIVSSKPRHGRAWRVIEERVLEDLVGELAGVANQLEDLGVFEVVRHLAAAALEGDEL